MKNIFKLGLLILFCTAPAFGQGYRYDDVATNQYGAPIVNAVITVCAGTTATIPCNPTLSLAPLYLNEALTTPTTNPLTSLPSGNYGFYIAPGDYTITISGVNLTSTNLFKTFPCTTSSTVSGCGGGGAGSVTGSGTLPNVTRFCAPTQVCNSSETDDLIMPVKSPNGLSVERGGTWGILANAASGTTQFLAVCRSPGNQATTCAAGTAIGLAGSAGSDAGTTGNVHFCYSGTCTFVFDDQTAVGDQAILSATNAGQLHDTGLTAKTPGVENVLVTSVNTGAGTTATVAILTPDTVGVPVPVVVPASSCVPGTTQITASYTIQPTDNCHNVDFTGTAAGQTVTLPAPGTGGSTPAFVSATSGSPTSGTSATVAHTFTAGNMAFVMCQSQASGGGASITGFSDNLGDTFQNVGANMSMVSGGNTIRLQTAFAMNLVGGATTITCFAGSSASAIQVNVGEYSTATGFDAFAQQTVASTTLGQNVTSPSISTSAPNELLIATAQYETCTVTAPGSGYTARFTSANFPVSGGAQEDQIVGAQASYVGNLTGGCGAATTFSAQVAAFHVSGTAGSYLDGFGFWLSDHGTHTLAYASSVNIIICPGSTAMSGTLAVGEEDWFESDGAGYRQECGQVSSGAGSGTVTNFSSGNFSPLFTTSVATGTTTPALSYTASNAAAHTFFMNNTGGSAPAAFGSPGTADLPFTYTTTNAATKLLTVSGTFTNGNCIAMGANGNAVDNGSACGSGGGGGTVTSVALALPATLFAVSGSPVNTTGTLTGAFISTAPANEIFGNCTGSTGTPNFCALTSAMIPNNAASTSGNSGTATALAATPSQCTGGQFATGIQASGAANCASTGTGTISGSGAANQIAMFSAATNIISSPMAVSGTAVSMTGGFTAGSLTSSGAGPGSVAMTAQPTVSGLPSASLSVGNLMVVSDSTTISAEGQTCVGTGTPGSGYALAFSNGIVWRCF